MANVTGPASSTDNAVPRWDGSSGDKIQNSGLVITDANNIQGATGDPRGTNATDLQVVRAQGSQVASGNDSVISGGVNNTASAPGATVSGGYGNTASGEYATVGGGANNSAPNGISTVAGGDANSASGEWCFIGGGYHNDIGTGSDYSTIAGGKNHNIARDTLVDTISGGESNEISADYCAIGGGRDNEVSGNYGTVPGGYRAKADKYGQIAVASGCFATTGDAQSSRFTLRISTANATPTELALDGVGTTFKFTVVAGSSWVFHGTIVGRDSNGNSACWEVKGGIKNVSGTTSLIGSTTVSLIGADAAAVTAGWGVAGAIAVGADNTNDALKITVTGAAGTNIRWVASIQTSEVSH
jgi:hypothetical protein